MKPILCLTLALVMLAGCQTSPGPAPQAETQITPPAPAQQQTVPEPAYARAQTELQAGNFEAAVALLEAAVAAHPNDARAQNDLCFGYIKLQRWPQAIKAGEAALAFDKQDPAIRFNLGRAYLGAKQYSNASTHLSLAYLKNDRNPDVAWYLGLAYEGENELLRAQEVYQKALTHHPGDADFAAAAKRVERALAQGSMILRADLTGDGQLSEIWARQGELRVISHSGKELLVFGGERARWYTSFQAKAVDIGMDLPILWVTAGPGCPGGHEHGLFVYDKRADQIKPLIWHGCATVVDFDKGRHEVRFSTRVIPSYVGTTYVFDGNELVESSRSESLVPDFIWPGNVYIALTKILQQGHDEDLFLDKTLADRFLKDWAGKGAIVTVAKVTETHERFTGQMTVKEGDRQAKATIHLVKVDDIWRVDKLEWQ